MNNDFHNQLAWSLDKRHEPFWNTVYKRAFPNMILNFLCDDKPSQLKGIDRYILLTNGKLLSIDEKKRMPNQITGQDYSDILLEYLSNDMTGKPGWIEKDLEIDYLAYGFIKSQVCYLLNWPMLRLAWIKYGDTWKILYPKIPAKNWTYTTWSVAVPTQILLSCVLFASVIPAY